MTAPRIIVGEMRTIPRGPWRVEVEGGVIEIVRGEEDTLTERIVELTADQARSLMLLLSAAIAEAQRA